MRIIDPPVTEIPISLAVLPTGSPLAYTEIKNFYGSISGLYCGAKGVKVGQSDDASKACRLSALDFRWYGASAQELIIYDNLTPWTLTMRDCWNAGGGMDISAADCKLTAVTIYLKSGVGTVNAVLDFSGNAISPASLTHVLGIVAGLSVIISASLDMSGGTNAGPTSESDWENVLTAASRGWSVSVNATQDIIVTNAPDTDLNGTYVWDESVGRFVNGNNYVAIEYYTPWADKYPVIVKGSVQTYVSYNGLVSSDGWYDTGDNPVATATALA